MNTIESRMKSRENNYDIIRLIAAIVVILSHAFPLSLGYINGRDPDPLFRWTNSLSLGSLAVMVFFIISGFLITQSYDRSRKPLQFLKARVLRIFPGLIFAVILTAFVLGPIVTSLPLKEYLLNHSTYKYLQNISLYFKVYLLPGIFENNAYPNVVNGSLWTLVYEFKCYLGVLLLGMMKLLRRDFVLFLFLASSALHILGKGGSDVEFLSFFSAGMVFYLFRKEIVLTPYWASLALAISLLCLTFYQPYFLPVIVICSTYVIMQLTYAQSFKLNGSKYGDLSYGTYIFAFPIQQTVTYYFNGKMEWWLNFIISLPITLVLAYLSWHLVEKQAQKLKKSKLKRSPSEQSPAAVTS